MSLRSVRNGVLPVVALAWLLQQGSLGLRKVAGPLESELTVVVTTELADPTQWLVGGEMVLTTGIGVPPDPQGRRDYVRRLREHGIGALGFGIGVSAERIPSELVSEADRAGLPLIEVPLRTPFVSVVRAVVDETGRRRALAAREVAQAQQRMTRAAVRGGPAAILRELASTCDAKVILFDRAGTVSASHPADVAEADVAAARAQVIEHPGSSASGARAGATLITQEVRVDRRSHGYVAVFAPRPIGDAQRAVIGAANSLLALDFEKPRQLRAEQRSVNEAAIALALDGDLDVRVAHRLIADGVGGGAIRVLVVIGPDDRLGGIADVVDEALARTHRPPFTYRGARSDEIVIVLPERDGTAAADTLLASVGDDRRVVRAGVSAPEPPARIRQATDDARAAARTATPGGPVVDAGDLSGRTVLTDGAVRAALDAFGAQVLAPLVDRESALTLRAYLAHNGHWESAAAELGVHRHTVRTRIGKIERALGVDFTDARVRAEVLLALLVRDNGE